MKIKTITCHDVGNVGASLQAYALRAYLSTLGHDVRIIDYKPGFKSKYHILFQVNNPKFDKPFIRFAYCAAKLPERIKWLKSEKHKIFREFKQNYLPTTKLYNSIDALRADPPEADVYFAGSDQIWNPVLPNGKDPSFYLDFVPQGKIKASYAASFSVSELPETLTSEVKSRLSRFDYISVREKSALDILKSLGITNGVQVLDPVFLLSRAEWENLAENITFKDKYILVYDFDRCNKIKKAAIKLAAETDCKIYSIFETDYAHRCFSTKGPLEFISLVKNAEYIISNSFHASAFSIIFEKQFWVFNREEDINTRMCDLTESLGIADRLVSDKENILKDSKIDYKRVYENLNPMIDFSKNYIDKVLKGAKKNEQQEKNTVRY